MTYCCGWISKNHVFLIADAAVTRPSIAQTEKRSSFGELHADTRSGYVEEAALKIDRIQTTAMTFAGHSRVGQQTEEDYASRLRNGADPRSALEQAVIANAMQLKRYPAELIVAYYQDGRPKLTSYNAGGTQAFVDHNDVVQIGSVGDVYKGFTKTLLEKIVPLSITPERQLVCVLSLAQSYGSFFYLMEQGVGGVHCGISVGEHGAQWQPDLLYTIHESSLEQVGGVSVLVREDALIVHSSISGDTRVFANTVSARCDLDHLGKLANAAEQFFRAARYDYVVFLNASRNIVVSIEMRGNTEHEYLLVKPKQDSISPSRFGVEFLITQKLHRMLTRRVLMADKNTPADVSIGSIPFRPRKRPQQQG